jgi:hypothetical protein
MPRLSNRKRTIVGAAAVLALVALVPGCGDGRKPVFPVRGQVLDTKEQPAAGAVVIFHPVAADSQDLAKPVGRVGEDGRFRLTTYKDGDGAPAGDYTITIQWPAPKKSPFDKEEPDQLKGRYADPGTSALRFSVQKKSDNEVPAIRLQ